MAKRKKKTKARPKTRASWKGRLAFGLVSFGVEAFNALDKQGSDIHFHQLHAECHSRIRYQKVCPVHGVVSNDEIVSGYEQRKGKYIEIDPDELDALRSQRERALTIDAFVSPETIDPLYFDGRMYYLLPDGAASQEPYAVIVAALEREERCGVGQVVFSGKDQIVLIRPFDGFLHMAMLNFEQEIRRPESLASPLKKPASLARQVRLAQTLIRDWSDDDFDFSAYEDTYREKVEELIKAKVKGHEMVTPEEEEEPEVVSLMDALKKSLTQMRGKGKRSTKTRRRRSA
jgi:DNA end-binding protein Ku